MFESKPFMGIYFNLSMPISTCLYAYVNLIIVGSDSGLSLSLYQVII